MIPWNLESPPLGYTADPAAGGGSSYDAATPSPGFQQQLDEARRQPETPKRVDDQREEAAADRQAAADRRPPASHGEEASGHPVRPSESNDAKQAADSAASTNADEQIAVADAAMKARMLEEASTDAVGNAKAVSDAKRNAKPSLGTKSEVGRRERGEPKPKAAPHGEQTDGASKKTPVDPKVGVERAPEDGTMPVQVGENKATTISEGAYAAACVMPSEATDLAATDPSAADKASDGLNDAIQFSGSASGHERARAATNGKAVPASPVPPAVEPPPKQQEAIPVASVAGQRSAAVASRPSSGEAKGQGKRAGANVESSERSEGSSEAERPNPNVVLPAAAPLESAAEQSGGLPPAPQEAPASDVRESTVEFGRPLPPVEGTANGGLKQPIIQTGPRGGGDELSGAGGASAVDRARFLQRVSRAIHAAVDGGGQMKLRLSPPELGSLKLEVTLKDGALSARFEAETPQARTLLLESAPALRERLSEQNIRLERYEVDLMRQPGEQADQFARQSREGQESRFDKGVNRRKTTTAAEMPAAPPPRREGSPGTDGRLNVVI